MFFSNKSAYISYDFLNDSVKLKIAFPSQE